MAKQDDWIRMTLRLPRDLHARIVGVDEASSLNAKIVSALEEQFPHTVEERLEALRDELDGMMNSKSPHKEKLKQLYEWGFRVLEQEMRDEKTRSSKR